MATAKQRAASKRNLAKARAKRKKGNGIGLTAAGAKFVAEHKAIQGRKARSVPMGPNYAQRVAAAKTGRKTHIPAFHA